MLASFSSMSFSSELILSSAFLVFLDIIQISRLNITFRVIFNWVSKVIRDWFCFTLLCEWSRKLAPPSKPIRYKTKTNRDLVTRVFPRLRPVTCVYFDFSLAPSDIFVCSNWPLWLLWFWFYDTQSKSALLEKYIKTTNHSSTSNSCGIMSATIETKPLQYHFRKLFSEQHVHYKLDWTVYSFHTHYKHIPLTSLDSNICFSNLSCYFIHSFGQYIHSALLKDKETRVSISHKLLIWSLQL